MSRRIATGGSGGAGAAPMHGAPSAPPADDYLGRLLKYIPAEIVGLYLATAGMLPTSAEFKKAQEHLRGKRPEPR